MKEDAKKVDTIDREMEVFYSSLGQLNTNIVIYLRNNPGEIAEIIDKIRLFVLSLESQDCSRFGPDYQWSETQRACVRKPRANELPELGGIA